MQMEYGKMLKPWRAVWVLCTISAIGLASASVHATTIVVDPANMGSWSFANADGNGIVGNNPTGSGSMVTGPATPPLGVGSANLATGNGTTGGDGAELLSNSGYAGMALSSLTALSYWTYDTVNNGQQFPVLQIEDLDEWAEHSGDRYLVLRASLSANRYRQPCLARSK